MMFSLPIPQNKQISEKYYFIPYDQDKPSTWSKFILRKKDTVH